MSTSIASRTAAGTWSRLAGGTTPNRSSRPSSDGSAGLSAVTSPSPSCCRAAAPGISMMTMSSWRSANAGTPTPACRRDASSSSTAVALAPAGRAVPATVVVATA
ncbi:hypothetical protein [Saccharothrix variisporea]|uniref:hypothetical protein n=1 Tax=Saccharothrix variisporea TaxID=543527 RepID=UPI001FE48CB5|nr:hypothetical protein [Saccharothrix variisporea]